MEYTKSDAIKQILALIIIIILAIALVRLYSYNHELEEQKEILTKERDMFLEINMNLTSDGIIDTAYTNGIMRGCNWGCVYAYNITTVADFNNTDYLNCENRCMEFRE